ncbi:MAG: hypothetical protein IID43_03070, partial [Planctomycetes bacterium]|nr:hypothetical protein [Planctomycetota bacterium]
ILSLTSVVIVDAEEQVVVERFGAVVQKESDALGPGLHLKWPFPIDIVRRAPVRRIDELVLGEATEDDDHPHSAILWTEQHDYVPELMLVVASVRDEGATMKQTETVASSAGSESTPVSLLMVSVPIEYRIKSIHDFLYNYDDPIKLMEAISYQYLQDYAASVDIDQLMGPGRAAFNRKLKRLIQERLDGFSPGVGIEIVFVGVRGAHPPAKSKVAEAFQSVIRAETLKGATISAAQGEARRILTNTAGTQARAKLLDEAILQRNRLEKDAASDPDALAEAEQVVENLLMGNTAAGIAPLSGQAAALIADARASTHGEVSRARTKARSFSAEVAAFEAAPELYKQRKRLEVFEDLAYVRKFLIVGDTSNVIIEYETRQEGALDQVLAQSVENERNKGR